MGFAKLTRFRIIIISINKTCFSKHKRRNDLPYGVQSDADIENIISPRAGYSNIIFTLSLMAHRGSREVFDRAAICE